MRLSDQQKNFIPWLKKQTGRSVILSGCAGTGKTTVMKHLSLSLGGKLMWVAPSHEACNVLRRSVDSKVITLQSALGLGPQFVNGDMVYVPKYRNKIISIDFLIIDEASMVSEYMLNMIMKADVKKIVFVGDAAQLPPVKGSVSPVFSKGMPEYELTEIFRQSKGSPIIQVAYDCRQHGKNTTKENGIKTVEMTRENIKKFYSEHSNGIILCPTHVMKDYCNGIKGEMSQLLLESPVDPPRGPSNGSVIQVLSSPVPTVFSGFNLLEVTIPGYTILIPSCEQERKKIKKHFSNLSWEYKKHPSESKQREIEILNNKITFAGPGHAITIHKSQGSTFEHVLLCIKGMAPFRNSGIHLNMLYTGITRASKTLMIGR